MSDFKAKMHQIVCRLGLCPRPRVYSVHFVYLYVLCNWSCPPPCYKIVPRPMLSVCTVPISQKRCIGYGYCKTLIGNPILEVEAAGQSGRSATGSGRNSNEAVARAASEAFARWLHHRYAPVELPSAWDIVLTRDTFLLVLMFFIGRTKLPYALQSVDINL